jgi:hypothetical protein
MSLSRRKFLLTSAVAATAGLAGGAAWGVSSLPEIAGANGVRHRLLTGKRSIEVNGRTATMLGLRQPDGTRGLVLEPGERFAVELHNQLHARATADIFRWTTSIAASQTQWRAQFRIRRQDFLDLHSMLPVIAVVAT